MESTIAQATTGDVVEDTGVATSYSIDDTSKMLYDSQLEEEQAQDAVYPEDLQIAASPTVATEDFGKVPHPNEMATAITSALEGRISYDEAVQRLVTDGGAQAIREAAAATAVKDMASHRSDFDKAATQGNLVSAELAARGIVQAERLYRKHMDNYTANVVVAKAAADNIVTTNSGTLLNNAPSKLAEEASAQGINFAISNVVQQHIAKKWGDSVPGMGSIVGYLGLYVGVPIGTALVTKNPWLTLGTGLASGASMAIDSFVVVPKAIEDATGIGKESALSYKGQIETFRNLVRNSPPEEGQKYLEDVTENIINSAYLSKANSSLGKMQAVIMLSKLYDAVYEGDMGKLELPLKYQEALDQIGLAADVIGAMHTLRKIGSASKVASELSGGASVGRVVGEEIVVPRNGTLNSLGLTTTDETSMALSFDLAHAMPEGIVGTSAEVQKAVKESVVRLLDEMSTRLTVAKDDKVLEAYETLKKSFELSDSRIANVNLEDGRVVIQHHSGNPFLSADKANEMAETLRKSTGIDWEVVPANNKGGAKLGSPLRVEVEHSDSLAMEIRLAEAEGRQLTVGDVLAAIKEDPSVINIQAAKPITMANKEGSIVAELLSGVADDVKIRFVENANDWIPVARSMHPTDEVLATEKAQKLAGLQGLYNPITNTLHINKGVATSPSLLMHEIAHAKMSGVIDVVLSGNDKAIKAARITDAQKKSVQILNTLFQEASEQLGSKLGAEFTYGKGSGDLYGFQDLHEFASELLSNGRFTNYLKEMRISSDTMDMLKAIDKSYGGGKLKTMWDAAVEMLGKILGVKNMKDTNLLARSLQSVSEIANSIEPHQQSMLLQLKKSGMSLNEIKAIFAAEEEGYGRLSHGFYVRSTTGTATHTAEDIQSRFALGLDPLHRASRAAVEERFITMLQEAKDKKAMSKFLSDAFDKLSSKEHVNVMRALAEGDALEQEFTVVELAARNVTTANEQQAYFTARTMSNINWQIKNQEAVKELSRRGFTQGTFSIAGQRISAPVRQLSATEAVGKHALDVSTGQFVQVSNAQLTAGQFVYQSARKIATANGDVDLIVGNITTGALQNPIPYRAGTFRRLYSDDYFARAITTSKLNGQDVEDYFHFKSARSGKDMDNYVAGMNNLLNKYKANPATLTLADVETSVGKWEDATALLNKFHSGDFDNVHKFETHFNREVDEYTSFFMKTGFDEMGSLLGTRGTKLEALNGGDNVLSVADAIQAELSSVSRMRNISEWRDKYVDMWWNSFKQFVPANLVNDTSLTPLQVMSRMSDEMYIGTNPAVKFAESQRKYILQQLGQKTLDERIVENSIVSLTSVLSEDAKFAGIPVGKGLVAAGHALRQANPLDFLRTVTFNLKLGMFNPAQLFVQANGAMTAVAISPVHGLNAAYSQPLLRLALMSDNTAVWDKLAGVYKASRLGLGDSGEFVRTVKAIRKTGLISNIGSTSLYDVEAGAFNVFNRTARKAQDKSMLFFNRGEEFNRMVAFDTARREYIAKNGVASWDSDAALREILVRTDDLTQNMSAANIARYQKGVLSIPSQFLQYNIKLLTNVTGAFVTGGKRVLGHSTEYRGFTAGEASRLMAAHVLAYGLVGNGLMDFYDETVGAYESAAGEKASNDVKLTISQGLMAGVINEIAQATTGEDMRLATGARFGTFDFYDRFVKALINPADTKLWEVLGGPNYGTMKGIGAVWDVVKVLHRDPNITAEDVLQGLHTIGYENISTWRNATKAYYMNMHEGVFANASGQPISNNTSLETLAQAVGVTPAGTDEYYRNNKTIRDHTHAIAELAKEHNKWSAIYYNELATNGNSARAKDLAQFMGTLVPKNPGDLRLFYHELKKPTAYPHRNLMEKDVYKYVTGQYNVKDVAASTSQISPTAPLVKE